MSPDHSHEHEENSMEEAGGIGVGFTGYITGFNSDAQARMVNALNEIGKWVDEKSGMFLGHIKCAIFLEDGTGVTLNLTNLENGIDIHGTLEPTEKVGFNILCAVLDVDKAELEHAVHHILEDTFLDIELIEHDGHHDHHEHNGHSHEHDGYHDHKCSEGHEHCNHPGHHHEHK